MIEKLNHYNILKIIYPYRNNFIIVNSAWMAVLGLRLNKDIDIVATDWLMREWETNNILKPITNEVIGRQIKHAKRYIQIAGAKNAEDLINRFSVKINEYNFIEFRFFYKIKKSRKRPTDKHDIKLIKEFFKTEKYLSDNLSFLPVSQWGI